MWEKHQVSEYTRRHLCLEDHEIWHNVRDGVTFYVVLPGHLNAPVEGYSGCVSLETALRRAGIHPGL